MDLCNIIQCNETVYYFEHATLVKLQQEGFLQNFNMQDYNVKIRETDKTLRGEKICCVDGVAKVWLQKLFKPFVLFTSLLAKC